MKMNLSKSFKSGFTHQNFLRKISGGFTLIELLVVVAIIGILASVVLASLNTARAKGADAAIKANLDNMRSQAEIYYPDNGNSYSGVCANGNMTAALAAANLQSDNSGACYDSATAWAAFAPLKTSLSTTPLVEEYWCVDNTGTSAQKSAPLASGATVCPAS
jgi:prepilin-type N-terminal cleavage/methylation domain-containing protein